MRKHRRYELALHIVRAWERDDVLDLRIAIAGRVARGVGIRELAVHLGDADGLASRRGNADETLSDPDFGARAGGREARAGDRVETLAGLVYQHDERIWRADDLLAGSE